MFVIATITWDHKVNIKSQHETREEAEIAKKSREAKLFGAAVTCYEILGPHQLKKALEAQEAFKASRRKSGQERAAKTRARNRELGREVHFITCPTCGAKSKKLYSEMGGLQTRRCKNGHLFEVDKFFGFETSKRQISSATRTPFDSIDPSYMQRRYGSDYKG